MPIALVGLNHRTAPLEVRERAAVPAERLRDELRAIAACPHVSEVAILSTCNRTEIVVVGPSFHESARWMTEYLLDRASAPSEVGGRYHYQFGGAGAVRHLCRVAAGLDSALLGETEVLGQVKQAYQAALDAGTAGKVLSAVMHRAIAAGKRTHTETRLGRRAISAAYAAVRLAEAELGSLSGLRALVVGAGRIGALTARYLAERGAKLSFHSRTRGHAESLALEHGGRVVSNLAAALADADLVVSQTNAPGVVIGGDVIREASLRRGGRPLLLIDLAVPRDIEPSAGEVAGVTLRDIDDIGAAVSVALAERQAEVAHAEQIVEDELEAFLHWEQAQQAVPVMHELRRKLERIRDAELERLFARLDGLDERERKLIRAAAGSMIGKILSDPMISLRQASEAGQADAYLDAVRRLFKLPVITEEEVPRRPGLDRRAAGDAE